MEQKAIKAVLGYSETRYAFTATDDALIVC